MSNRPNTSRRASPAPPTSRSYLWPVVIGVIILAGIAAIAASALGGSDDDTSTGSGEETPGSDGERPDAPDPRELDSVSVSGTALTEYTTSIDDPAVGKTAPVLEGVDTYGEPMTIGGGGTPTVIVFLAHWCPHCQREVPVLVDWLDENGPPEGVDIVGVTTAFDEPSGNWPPADWLEDEGWDLPTMVDPSEEAAEVYGLSGFPYFVALDGEGNVTARASGELTIPEWEALIDTARTTVS